MKLYIRIPLAILSAALLTFSFVPLGHHLLVWVALIPPLLGIEGASHRVAFRLGFLCGMLLLRCHIPVRGPAYRSERRRDARGAQL